MVRRARVGHHESVELDAVETEREHVRIPILLEESLAETFEDFIVLLFVTIESIEYAVLDFGLALLNERLEFGHATRVEILVRGALLVLKEQVRVNWDALLQAFDLNAGVYEAVGHVLQVVRTLDLQLAAFERLVVHQQLLSILAVLFAHLILVLSLFYGFGGTIRVLRDRHRSPHVKGICVDRRHFLKVLLNEAASVWAVAGNHVLQFLVLVVLFI